MRRTSIAVLGTMLIAALALVAAGCGGGGKKTAATTTTAAATTEAAATAAATTEAATTEAATTEATTTEAATTEAATTEAATTETTATSDLAKIASAANCKELADLGQKFSSAFSGAASGQDLKKQAELLKEFADKTPEDIRPAFQVVADYFTKLVGVVGNIKSGQTPDPETLAKLQKLSTEVDSAKLQQASQNITAWVTKNCRS
jgi:hypothetical protein